VKVVRHETISINTKAIPCTTSAQNRQNNINDRLVAKIVPLLICSARDEIGMRPRVIKTRKSWCMLPLLQHYLIPLRAGLKTRPYILPPDLVGTDL